MDYGRRTDEDLLSRFRGGDSAAFEALIDRYSGPIYNFALRFLGNPQDAEDAAQQTFVQAFESLPGARPGSPVRPWLFQVARNKCIDMLRRRRTVPLGRPDRDETEEEPGPPDSGPLPDAMYERAELQQLLQDAILTLAPRSREVVVMRYVGELTFAEIAEALGMPENTAKTLFQRAKTTLRAYLHRRL